MLSPFIAVDQHRYICTHSLCLLRVAPMSSMVCCGFEMLSSLHPVYIMNGGSSISNTEGRKLHRKYTNITYTTHIHTHICSGRVKLNRTYILHCVFTDRKDINRPRRRCVIHDNRTTPLIVRYVFFASRMANRGRLPYVTGMRVLQTIYVDIFKYSVFFLFRI